MNSLHALIGTRLKKPSRRRSKNPATPTTIARPMKWIVSHNGHTHEMLRRYVDSCQLATHTTT
jgi:hypothetical protein